MATLLAATRASGASLAGRQMQVGEEHLVLPGGQSGIFLGNRFFDFQDQLAIGPHVVNIVDNGRAR